MDEVNADDLNELESRLYAQLHHEETPNLIEKDTNYSNDVLSQLPQEPNVNVFMNKVPPTRYWAKSKNRVLVNDAATKSKPSTSGKNEAINCGEKGKSKTERYTFSANNNTPTVPKSTFKSPKPKKKKCNAPNSKSRSQIETHPLHADLRINPAVVAKQKNKQRLERQLQKDGPFAKKMQKLEKAKRINAKKKKSKEVQSKRTYISETIELKSSDESGNDDVIVLGVPPVVVISVDDSDEDEKLKISQKDDAEMQEFDENAVDAADIEASFTKPQTQLTTVHTHEKPADHISRCNSPCSVLSSDDFIWQNDRARLLETNGPADDEDLLILTENVDKNQNALAEKDNLAKTQFVDASLMEDNVSVLEESSNEVECVNFVEPVSKSAKERKRARKENYRVDQPQFRAIDVYESESDITDSVYSKGTSKPTIIRSLGSSSEGEEEWPIENSQRSKRIRKRHVSGSQRDPETNDEDNSTNSESDDVNINSGVGATAIPFIRCGSAIEGFSSSNRRRLSTSGQMCDNEFIATLNSLAQGGDCDSDDDDDDNNDENNDLNKGCADDDDSDLDEAPTARDIAEEVLKQSFRNKNRISKNMPTTTVENMASECSQIITIDAPTNFADVALPDDALVELDKVFETIDEIECPITKPDELDNTTLVESDSSDEEINNDADVQIIDDSGPASKQPTSSKATRRTEGPVYNVVYSEGSRFPGGFGWNDEMRRFYNDSWNGENFNLHQIWNQQNHNKNLWKIYSEDRFPKQRQFTNLKCHNCCEFGHTRAKCKRPKKYPICYMCGESGHYEPRCPNTICLRCGKKTHVFTKSCNACTFQNRLCCPLCKVRGHTLNFCPDKWRRYHSTTEPNSYPNSLVEYRNKKYCCVCGKRGHSSEYCKSVVRFMEYPVIVSNIKSHQKSYNDISTKTSQTGIAYNMLYKPTEDYSFEIAERTTKTNYYGRFLNAVGMGYLLSRKRKLDKQTAANQARNVPLSYAPNPYLKRGRQVQTTASAADAATAAETEVPQDNTQDAPDQVPEISESGNFEIDRANIEQQAGVGSIDDDFEVDSVENVIAIELDTMEIEDENLREAARPCDGTQKDAELNPTEEPTNHESHNFKTPTEVPIAQCQRQSQSQPSNEQDALPMDSDSNYSFSEHFDMPSTIPAEGTTGNAEIEPMPDYIPLNAGADAMVVDGNSDDDSGDVALQVGISRRYVTVHTQDDESRSISPLPDLPCEAKIYLTHFHSKYLLSPEGNAFLVEKSKACNIRARLDFTSVGHVLVIFGLPSNQNNFHRELLMKYRQLMDQMNNRRLESSQKVPKRADVLIRFLRESVNQLFTNLGNVNELLKRLKQLKNQHSKTGLKSAERARRTLNMILLGQAGLVDGNMHLDKLLLNLKTLINDYNPDDVASSELRDEIDNHWRVIFTSYRHDNYPELVQTYNKLISKNRLRNLNIDPLLLGNKVLDKCVLNEQKGRTQHQQKRRIDGAVLGVVKKHSGFVPNPLNPKNSKLLKKKQNKSATTTLSTIDAVTQSQNLYTFMSRSPSPPPPPPPSMKLKSSPEKKDFVSTPQSAKTKATKKATRPPFANPEQSSAITTKISAATANWHSACDNLLTGIDAPLGEMKKGHVRVSKGPSIFWSRESLRYIDECIKLAECNPQMLEKLQRVQNKSQSGYLSYNDYRAVIKLHSAMLGQ